MDDTSFTTTNVKWAFHILSSTQNMHSMNCVKLKYMDATVHLGRTVHTNALQTAREVFVTATQAIALVVNRDTRVLTVARVCLFKLFKRT